MRLKRPLGDEDVLAVGREEARARVERGGGRKGPVVAAQLEEMARRGTHRLARRERKLEEGGRAAVGSMRHEDDVRVGEPARAVRREDAVAHLHLRDLAHTACLQSDRVVAVEARVVRGRLVVGVLAEAARLAAPAVGVAALALAGARLPLPIRDHELAALGLLARRAARGVVRDVAAGRAALSVVPLSECGGRCQSCACECWSAPAK